MAAFGAGIVREAGEWNGLGRSGSSWQDIEADRHIWLWFKPRERRHPNGKLSSLLYPPCLKEGKN